MKEDALCNFGFEMPTSEIAAFHLHRCLFHIISILCHDIIATYLCISQAKCCMMSGMILKYQPEDETQC